jgi:LPXTG-site transpeptidase (sortase) family protein
MKKYILKGKKSNYYTRRGEMKIRTFRGCFALFARAFSGGGNVEILGERRVCALLLAAAGSLACLMLLFTTSSGAQAQAVARSEGAVAAAGEDCVEFEDEAGDEDNNGTGLDSVQNENNDTVDTEQINDTGGTSGSGADLYVGTQQSDTVTSQQVQDDESGDVQQSLDTGNEGNGNDNLQSQESEDEDNGDTTSNNTEDTGDTTSNDATSEDETSNNAQDNGDTLSDDTEDNDDECVVAKSVPDELLPPTGISAKPRNDDPAEKKKSDRQKKQSTRGANSSDRNEKASDRDGEQKTSAAKKQSSRVQEQKKSGGKKKVEIKDRLSGKTVEVEDRSSKKPRQESLGDRSKAATTPDPAPRLAANWSSPSRQELVSAGKLRRFAPNPAGSEMTMSVRALGLYDAPVASSGRRENLDYGLIRMPRTDLPWSEGKEKNVYVAGHYLGLEGTNSRMVFYNLHKLKKGDEIALKDSLGQVYKYRVSEKFAAESDDNWAMGKVRDRDMLTLQTCIPPDFGKRLLVRADRVRNNR